MAFNLSDPMGLDPSNPMALDPWDTDSSEEETERHRVLAHRHYLLMQARYTELDTSSETSRQSNKRKRSANRKKVPPTSQDSEPTTEQTSKDKKKALLTPNDSELETEQTPKNEEKVLVASNDSEFETEEIPTNGKVLSTSNDSEIRTGKTSTNGEVLSTSNDSDLETGKDPRQSTWYIKYGLNGERLGVTDLKYFRRMFALPYENFEELLNEINNEPEIAKWANDKRNCARTPSSTLTLLLLGSLRLLKGGCGIDCQLLSGIHEDTHHQFFPIFLKYTRSDLFKHGKLLNRYLKKFVK